MVLVATSVPTTHAALAVAGPLFVMGLGSGALITPNQALTLMDVDPVVGSTAGGVLQTAQRVGLAVGQAVIGAVFFGAVGGSGAASYAHALAAATSASLVFVGAGDRGRDLRGGPREAGDMTDGRRRHPFAMTVGLMVLAPVVGEFLLGNTPISQLGALLLFLPLYGAGAVLVRECGRRLGGWRAIVPFAAAYALVEEAPVDQMVFNPGYLGLGSFDAYGEIPGVGISGTLVVYSLALHTVWSICVPLAVVEAFDPTPGEPWLRRRGLAVVAAVFVLGCVSLGVVQAQDQHFMGSPAQFVVSGLAILALVGLGILWGRRQAQPAAGAGAPSRPAPRPFLLGLAAFVLTSAYWFGSGLPGLLLQVAWLGLAVVVAVLLVRRWSRREDWGGRHRLALAAGAAATYALWFGPSQAVEAGTGPGEILVGAVVFGLVVLAVLIAASRSLRSRRPD